MYKFLYLCNNILAGILLGIFAPILLISHLANKTNRYYLNMLLGLSLLFLFVQLMIALFHSIAIGVIVYLTPWVVISILNDFSFFDREEKEIEEENE